MLDLKFQNALIQLVQNEEYVDPMLTLGTLVHARVKQYVYVRYHIITLISLLLQAPYSAKARSVSIIPDIRQTLAAIWIIPRYLGLFRNQTFAKNHTGFRKRYCAPKKVEKACR